ncbi:MAG TPA: hypothetical protein VLF18_11685 [Tahibacter sp.]|uniref:hypothetical protein n=1 Tax=Tahibacter sp. TaxID=2056211 RepID=UPI002B760B94|nr:hypothetical protein [Tahibacter sp.]HSX60852.1 hypothetical protein [Tahibacter sp.]
MLNHLPPLRAWLALPDREKDDVLADVRAELALTRPFTIARDAHAVPRVVVDYGAAIGSIAFRLVPSHDVPVGLSGSNLAAIRNITDEPQITVEEMTPLVRVDVDAFLVAELPLSNAQVRALFDNSFDGQDEFPAYLDERAAFGAMRALDAALPSEAQWECIAKAGGDPLFPFGDALLPEVAIEPWMRYDLSDPGTARTRFGTGGLFFAEWCGDVFAASHAPHAERLADTRTIKGGGAYFWPWQDDEWVWCLCSMRMPSSDLDGGIAVCRPVISL